MGNKEHLQAQLSKTELEHPWGEIQEVGGSLVVGAMPVQCTCQMPNLGRHPGTASRAVPQLPGGGSAL